MRRARAGHQGDFGKDYSSPRCQVEIGCWGPGGELLWQAEVERPADGRGVI